MVTNINMESYWNSNAWGCYMEGYWNPNAWGCLVSQECHMSIQHEEKNTSILKLEKKS